MLTDVWDRMWHQWLRRPYQLACVLDQGRGQPVVLLHGIGRSGQVWQHVVALLQDRGYRVVVFDLLGCGASPKPGWPRYDGDDHARAVLASIRRLRLNERVILVGHSMGALVAARAARRRPQLARHLVLYEMPLYSGLPEKRHYRLRLDLYKRFYARVMAYQPNFDTANQRLTERLARRIVGLEVTRDSWQPFIKSLQHTILEQTTADDLKHIAAPIDVIYGRLDIFVIRGKPQHVFGTDTPHIATHTIRARHVITPRASQFLVDRIAAAMEQTADD